MSSPSSSLRPAWNRGGRGFQPPPTVKSRSALPDSSNKFAALDDDDDNDGWIHTTSSNNRPRSGSAAGRSLADLAGSSSAAATRPQQRTPPRTTVRYTREKLLALRPTVTALDDNLLSSVGLPLLTEAPQDPVCWDDSLDADAVWAGIVAANAANISASHPYNNIMGAAVVTTARAPKGAPRGGGGRRNERSHNRWERGVALPPPQSKAAAAAAAENPADLWDDPVDMTAAADFSAFGAMPEDDTDPKPPPATATTNTGFDFAKMAEATAQLDEEKKREENGHSLEAEEDEDLAVQKIDPKRPLASVGTTIRAGNVNVFEDFGDPASAEQKQQQGGETASPPNKGESDSSKLMAMIGVTRTEAEATKESAVPSVSGGWGASPSEGNNNSNNNDASIPLNPWGGGPLLPNNNDRGFDLENRLREEAELKARQAELAARRQLQQQQLAQQHQQQAEEQRRAQAQQQQAGVQSQVELVLMERISTILEKSWGQADLASILSTLHSQDPRVVSLLGSTDALKALISRNPRRVALQPNPVFGTDMAALLLTNAQWQQQQQHEQMTQAQSAEARHQMNMQQQQRDGPVDLAKSINFDAPWYYSDPQQNIQGPFRGEEMRQWLEAGYFKSDLPISQQQTGPFRALRDWFPDQAVAFVPSRDTAAEEAAAAAQEQARLEAERAEAEALKREMEERAHAAAREERAQQEERQRREQEAAAQGSSGNGGSGNESSNQLKMMLGLGGGGGDAGASDDSRTRTQEPKPQQPKPEGKSKGSKKSQKAKSQDPAATATSPLPAPQAKGGSAWGGASKPVAKKSMSEIQHEEARAAAIVAMKQEGGRRSGSGWANVAASRGGSTGWTGGSASRQPAAVVLKKQQVAPTTARGPPPTPAVADSSNNNHKSAPKVSGPAPAAPDRGASAQKTDADEFGAKIPPALANFCRDQLVRLQGSDDLTLISFCMSLNDDNDIRAYLEAYLGTSGPVKNFANEFIKRKGNGKQQEQWETTATGKKGRKKKGR